MGLGDADDVESADAVAAGNAAYIIQRSATATRVSLVGRDTVEAAVQATAAGGGTVRPRGFVEIDTVVLDEPGRVLGDGHALWVLAGTGDDLEVLRIEPDRERPRVLTVDAEATVQAPAALALHHTDGRRVAVVGADGGRLLGGEGGEAALADDGAESRADTVLPVGTETGPATFLRHRPDGWEVVTAGADGALDRAAIEGIGDQQLTPGATAGGEVWTYALPAAGSAPAADDDGQPALLRIDRSGQAEPVAGMDRYPRKAAGELAGFEDAAVVARSGRVVFNNPASVLAVMAFAEDDRPPVVIDKSTAIDVSANGAVATGEEEHAGPGRGRRRTTRRRTGRRRTGPRHRERRRAVRGDRLAATRPRAEGAVDVDPHCHHHVVVPAARQRRLPPVVVLGVGARAAGSPAGATVRRGRRADVHGRVWSPTRHGLRVHRHRVSERSFDPLAAAHRNDPPHRPRRSHRGAGDGRRPGRMGRHLAILRERRVRRAGGGVGGDRLALRWRLRGRTPRGARRRHDAHGHDRRQRPRVARRGAVVPCAGRGLRRSRR